MAILRERTGNGVHPPSDDAAKANGKQNTEFIETHNHNLAEKGGQKVVGTVEEDIPLTQEDFDFMTEYEATGKGKKAIRKMDLRIIPILVIIYLAAFLDRGNIGNARIEGLEADLGISSQQYQWCLSVFFFAYATGEIFANIPLKIFRPSVWLPCCILAWGTVMTLMGIVQGYGGLIATRFFLGLTEAPFFPGAMFILSNWYRREELQRRISYLYAVGVFRACQTWKKLTGLKTQSASVAGAFSGILAFAIAKMDGIAGQAGWRWIFIIEGLMTILIALASPFLIHDSIESSKWLDQDEKRFLRTRLAMDRQGRVKGNFKKLYLKQALTDYKIWACSFIYFADAVGTYGLSFSLPTIIRQLGYTSAIAQLLTIPTYLFAAIFTVACAFVGDRTRKRMVMVLVSYLTAIAGLIICLATPQPRLPGLILFAVYLIAAGVYSVVPAIIAWNSNNASGEWKRGIAIGMQIGITNYGGVIGSNIFLAKESPRYPLGYGFSLAILAAACILAVILHTLLKRENKRRDRMSEAEVRAKYTEDELADMGDASPLFRYET